ncbi:MAG: tetratricopeptide repeat protein [Candidatus Thorarchaeota archaeon]|nr:tetratricopeptide repeat protein [Candidatus Thorarchaeota archaeon]
MKKEQWIDAEVSFRKALDLEPDYPHAWMGLAVALQRLERFAEAHEHTRVC